ncbi:MAG: ABC transporter permease [Bdellovibrionales bacterium]|nr:ABC transporter permease [Bdellovibrionales bacterium]
MFYTRARLESEVVRNYIGYLWWVLDPALSVCVYYVVFKLILERGGPDYIQFLAIGIIAWKWFATSVNKGAMSIFQQKKLIQKIYLPKIIFPHIDLNFHTVKFLAIFIPMVFVFALIGYPLSIYHLYLPVLIVCQFIFIIGLTTFLSSLTPFFPDTNFILSHILRLAFYPSGVLFDLRRVPEKYRWIIDINPMAQAIQSYRDIIMHQMPPSYFGFLLLAGLGTVLYTIGFFIISKNEGNYAKLA